MRIATFNVNNVNRRLPNLLAWLEETAPDVVCLQELKARHGNFPQAELSEAGYGAVWRGERQWNGVAILARGAEPVLTRDELPGDPNDRQSRYIEAAVQGVLIASIYLPNGNPQPGPKFDYKLAFLDRLLAHARMLAESDLPVVLAGDYNVVPTEFDVFPGHKLADNALLQPEPRAAFEELLGQGWCDALRVLHPTERFYTFWDYKNDRFVRDDGLRLDHLLLSPSLAPHLKGGGVDRAVRGAAEASDHAPAWIELADVGFDQTEGRDRR